MGFINKALVAVALGAAIGLKDQVVKSNSSALKLNRFAAVGPSSSSMLLFRRGPQGSLEKPGGGAAPCRAMEEPLRMVVYLSSWGPNWRGGSPFFFLFFFPCGLEVQHSLITQVDGADARAASLINNNVYPTCEVRSYEDLHVVHSCIFFFLLSLY